MLIFCEKNKDLAYMVNTLVTKELLKYTPKLVFISTDSIYEGTIGNYKEIDEKKPSNYYAFTKSIAEDFVLEKSNNLIIRTNIFGYGSKGKKSLFEWAFNKLNKNEKIFGYVDVFLIHFIQKI